MKERGAMKAKLASTALAVVLAAGMCPPLRRSRLKGR